MEPGCLHWELKESEPLNHQGSSDHISSFSVVSNPCLLWICHGWVRTLSPGITLPVRVYILSVVLNKTLETASFAAHWGTQHGLEKELEVEKSRDHPVDPNRERLKNKSHLALYKK